MKQARHAPVTIKIWVQVSEVNVEQSSLLKVIDRRVLLDERNQLLHIADELIPRQAGVFQLGTDDIGMIVTGRYRCLGRAGLLQAEMHR